MTRTNRTLQLDKENAKWLGVCAGLANFLEVEAWTVRLVFLGTMFFGGWFLVPLYFIAWYLQTLYVTFAARLNHFPTLRRSQPLYRSYGFS